MRATAAETVKAAAAKAVSDAETEYDRIKTLYSGMADFNSTEAKKIKADLDSAGSLIT